MPYRLSEPGKDALSLMVRCNVLELLLSCRVNTRLYNGREDRWRRSEFEIEVAERSFQTRSSEQCRALTDFPLKEHKFPCSVSSGCSRSIEAGANLTASTTSRSPEHKFDSNQTISASSKTRISFRSTAQDEARMSKSQDPPPPPYTPQNPAFQPGPGATAYTNGHPLQQQPYASNPDQGPPQQPQPTYQQGADGAGERVIVVEERHASGEDVLLGCCAGCAAGCCCCGCVVM